MSSALIQKLLQKYSIQTVASTQYTNQLIDKLFELSSSLVTENYETFKIHASTTQFVDIITENNNKHNILGFQFWSIIKPSCYCPFQ